MPEYLSPGVYVEEIDRGRRPIAGVSTSTAGVVGMTERGPEEVPVFVSSVGEFTRLFGGLLRPDAVLDRWHLPLAVQGFFRNGGRRLWVVRVAGQGATRARVTLMDQGVPTGVATELASRAQAEDGVIVVLSGAGMAAGDRLRLSDDAATEYVMFFASAALTGAVGRGLGLGTPAAVGYDPATGIEDAALVVGAGPAAYAGALAAAAGAGATQLVLDSLPAAGNNALAAGDVLVLAPLAGVRREVVEVAAGPTDPTNPTVRLHYPLARAHPATEAVERWTSAPAAMPLLARPVRAGDGLAVLDAAVPPGLDVVRFTDATSAARHGYHPVAAPVVATLRRDLTEEHAAGTVVDALVMAAAGGGYNQAIVGGAPAGATEVAVPGGTLPGGLAIGDWVQLTGPTIEFAQLAAVDDPPNTVTVRQPLAGDHTGGNVIEQATAPDPTVLLERSHVAARHTIVAQTATGVAVDQVLAIGDPADVDYEYLEVSGTVAGSIVRLDPAWQVRAGHRSSVDVAGREELLVVEALDRGAWGNNVRVTVAEESAATVDTTVRTTALPATDVELTSVTGVEPGTLLELIDFSSTIALYAPAGATHVDLATASGALNPGDWIRLGRQDPELARVTATGPGTTRVQIDRPLLRDHGVGEWVDRMGPTGSPRLAKVQRRIGASSVRFDTGGLPFAVLAGSVVRSREFQVRVEVVRQNPRAAGTLIVETSEDFRRLTLDSRHSRYIGTVIGHTAGPPQLWDRRTAGQSLLVRVQDPLFTPAGADATQGELRTAPDLITEPTSGGRRRPVGRMLGVVVGTDVAGDDDVAGVNDLRYIGQDNIDPDLRTGIQALRNIEDISIVAVPGQTSAAVQTELIGHCERERYRFAVLDGVPGVQPSGATIPEILAHRQQYDTRYGALYVPWVLVTDPFGRPPDPLSGRAEPLAVPPSGHMLGVYANTDNTDGVHKAPANEVVAGIVGMQRAITKAEHDLLNPDPVNVNVLRDFRANFRGLRSFGARVITNDPAWRYVNVRRLFIFVERSLDLGLQWITFMPNDQDLWAAVRRTVSDFLTAVWRSGALMGETAEEAFYVICDRTVMTQSDIDNGRLIVEIGIAPVKPAEFVIVRISQWPGGSAVDET